MTDHRDRAPAAAPPTPPSASLVEADVLAMARKALAGPDGHLSNDEWLERYEAALTDIRDRLTAHPAADAPPSDEENDR